MIIFLDSSGNIVVPASPERIGRCSNDASVIYIVSPLSDGAEIYLTFTLPNGEPLFGNLAEPTEDTLERDARQAATYLFGAGDLSAWRYKVPSPVTQYAGTVHYTVCTVMGTVRATASGTFNVSRGNKIIVPSDPTPDQWDTVLAALGQENADNLNVWTAMFGEGGEPNNPKEGSLAAQLIAAQEDCLSVRTEIYGKNGTPDAPEEGSLAAEVMNLGRDFGEIPGWSEDADADTLVLRDTNGFVRTAMHADRQAFEGGPAEDAVALGDARAFLPYDFALHMDASTYILSFTVKNANGETRFFQQVDLPLESVWIKAAYDAETKSIVLTPRKGDEVYVDVSAITGGLVNRDDFDAELAKKVDRTEEALKVYGTKGRGPDGKTIQEPYDVDISAMKAGTILQASAPTNSSFDRKVPTATFAVCDPQKPYQPATKQYVDNGLAGKLDKITKTWQAYTTDAQGNTVATPLADKPSSGGVVLYNEGGILKTNAPVEDNDAASKEYVDNGFVPRSKRGWALYGTDGTPDENGYMGNRAVYISCLGTKANCVAVYQKATDAIQFPDTTNPICTIAVADPIKWFQAANRRYVENTVAPMQRDIRALNDAALGKLYTFEIFTFTKQFNDLPSGVLAHAYVRHIGPFKLYIIRNDGEKDFVGTANTCIVIFRDVDGIKISEFAPTMGEYFEIPEGAKSMYFEPVDISYNEGYSNYDNVEADFVVEMQVKVGG